MQHLVASQPDGQPVTRRPSLMSQVSSTLTSWSHVTLNKSRSAAHVVGSYLGVTDAQDLNVWKKKLLQRAESGELGLKIPVLRTAAVRRESAAQHLEAVLQDISSRQSLRDTNDTNERRMSDYIIHFDNEYISPSASTEEEPGQPTQESSSCEQNDHDLQQGTPHHVENRARYRGKGDVHQGREMEMCATEITSSQLETNMGRRDMESHSLRRSKSAHLRARFFADMYANVGIPTSPDPFVSVEDISTVEGGTYNSDTQMTSERKTPSLIENNVDLKKDFDAVDGCFDQTKGRNQYSWLATEAPDSNKMPWLELESSKASGTPPFNNAIPTVTESATSIEGSLFEPTDSQAIKGGQKSEVQLELERFPVLCSTSDPYNAGTTSGKMKWNWLKLEDDYDDNLVVEGSHSTASYQLSHKSSILKKTSVSSSRSGSVTFSPQVTEHGHTLGVTVSQLKTTPSDEEVRKRNKNLSNREINRDGKLLYADEAFRRYREFMQREQQLKLDELYDRKEDLKAELLTDLHELKEAMASLQEDMDSTDRSGNIFKRLKRQIVKPRSARVDSGILDFTDGGSSHGVGDHTQSKLPRSRVWLIYVICLLQILFFAVFGIKEGISNLWLEPSVVLGSQIRTFRGRETIEHWELPNIWVGPDPYALIHYGAVFAPCMRDDVSILLDYARQGYNMKEQLGCCEVRLRNTAGTTTQAECTDLTNGIGEWRGGIMCGDRHWSRRSVTHNMWPCCYGLRAQCILASVDHCDLLQGVLHYDFDHCTQVNCRSGLCGMGGLPADETLPYLPSKTDQQWRLVVGIFLHQGVISLTLVVMLQWLIGPQIEELAGWFRLLVIYLSSGMMSLLIGSTFSPYLPHCGGGGAAFSLLGVLLVELLQSWHHMKRPWCELGKLVLVVALAILSGTLPYVDTFEILGGLICGMLMGIALMPYVTFGRWRTARRRLLMILTLPILTGIIVLAVYLFYHIQTVNEACKTCQLINCIPYTNTMCNMTRLT